MNRTTVRVIGVMIGIIAGTGAALISRSIRQQRAAQAEVESMEESNEESMEPAPDPGRRRALKSLRDSASNEPNWTREFEYTERSGKTIKSEDLRGEPYVACFFFSTCPGTCTRQSGEMRLLQSKFRGKPVKFVSISVDPEVDTPEVLSEYAEKFNADRERWLFLTGPIETTMRVGAEMFFLPGVQKRGHPDRFCLVDANGVLVGSYVWKDADEREQLIRHIQELVDERT